MAATKLDEPLRSEYIAYIERNYLPHVFERGQELNMTLGFIERCKDSIKRSQLLDQLIARTKWDRQKANKTLQSLSHQERQALMTASGITSTEQRGGAAAAATTDPPLQHNVVYENRNRQYYRDFTPIQRSPLDQYQHYLRSPNAQSPPLIMMPRFHLGRYHTTEGAGGADGAGRAKSAPLRGGSASAQQQSPLSQQPRDDFTRGFVDVKPQLLRQLKQLLFKKKNRQKMNIEH